ncbi:MAG TPA: UDP-glucose/GDP-mannose dehydrogenase family protein [Acidimicrobiales bacterium]|nr:UDP-glucose/GDP-mannose dehydrogenase family protein [Acidimicrobiales bacterium]
MTNNAGNQPATIAVIGAGYVGLTTAVCLAHLGNSVVAVDVDEAKVETLNRGEPTILEEGLPKLLEEGISSGRLTFSSDPSAAAAGAGFVFLCVPTPQGADGAADLSYVQQAASQIAPHLTPGAVVVTKSTVPVGSAALVVTALNRPDTSVVSNPEFLREGKAVSDWLHPDRVVIGADDRAAGEKLAALYEPLGAPILITDPASSETIKYACNAFLAAKVSFVNAIANLCQVVGADSMDVIRGMSYDRRIGADHLAPGPGWGGSCFPKDTSALLRIADEHGYDFSLLREVIAANERQFEHVTDQVAAAAGRPLEGATVAAWGLTFKAATDDLRESPAIAVLRQLVSRGAKVKAFDPTLPTPDHSCLAGLELEVCDDPYTAVEGAHALVVLTEWPEFCSLDLKKVAATMEHPSIVDTRNMLDPASARSAGCEYAGMGRS